MLFRLPLAIIFGVLAAAAPMNPLGADGICGFAHHDDGKSASQYTYFGLDECRTLGDAVPVRNMYRDASCDCTFYRDAECQTSAWYLSVDYGVLPEDVGELSGYYKCTVRSHGEEELKRK